MAEKTSACDSPEIQLLHNQFIAVLKARQIWNVAELIQQLLGELARMSLAEKRAQVDKLKFGWIVFAIFCLN
ncbi:MAG: hypothetical protein AAFY20_20140 [Cyanobacteria bacterium J06639_14]